MRSNKQRFENSPLSKVFTSALDKEDSKKVGIFKRLKNIEDNLTDDDGDSDNKKKISLFKIIKDIKDKGIKINNDDEAIKEIRKKIGFLRNRGVTDFKIADMRAEIRLYIQDLKDKGIKTRVDDEQLNEFLNKIFEGIKIKDTGQKDVGLEDIDLKYTSLKNININKFFEKYNEKSLSTYHIGKIGRHNIDTTDIHNNFNDWITKIISRDEFLKKFNMFINKTDALNSFKRSKPKGAISKNQVNIKI